MIEPNSDELASAVRSLRAAIGQRDVLFAAICAVTNVANVQAAMKEWYADFAPGSDVEFEPPTKTALLITARNICLDRNRWR
jgi:hypothetical protein